MQVEGLLGRGPRPRLRLPYRGAHMADELGVEQKLASDAVHNRWHVESAGQQGPRRLQHFMDNEVWRRCCCAITTRSASRASAGLPNSATTPPIVLRSSGRPVSAHTAWFADHV